MVNNFIEMCMYLCLAYVLWCDNGKSLIRSWRGSILTRTEMGEVVNSELNNSDFFFFFFPVDN